MRKFQDLTVWQKAHQLVLNLYQATKHFPREERYGLVNQMRRAAISIPANIVEGHKRRSKREFAHFMSIAEGSLEELKYYIYLSGDLGYLSDTSDTSAKQLYRCAEEVGRMLYGFKMHIKEEMRNETVLPR